MAHEVDAHHVPEEVAAKPGEWTPFGVAGLPSCRFPPSRGVRTAGGDRSRRSFNLLPQFRGSVFLAGLVEGEDAYVGEAGGEEGEEGHGDVVAAARG